MSGKKVKLERKEPKLVAQVVISFYDDKRTTVSGFYDNLDMALSQLHSGERAIINHFMNKPKSNLIKLNG